MSKSGPRFEDHPTHIEQMMRASITRADPGEALARAWAASIRETGGMGGRSGDARPHVVCAGKAGVPMLRALLSRCEVRPAGGVCVIPAGQREALGDVGPIEVFEADHPIATARNVEGAEHVAAYARSLRREDTLIALISGGASAHLTLPAPGIELEDLRDITNALLRAGAPIEELNCVRKHCELLKGGGLARLACSGAQGEGHAVIRGFILRDVIGAGLDAVASGPTLGDPTTFRNASDVLDRARLWDANQRVTERIRAGVAGKIPETLKPGDPILHAVNNAEIGSNDDAVAGVEECALGLGIDVVDLQTGVQGEAREVGVKMARKLLSLRERRAASAGPVGVIWGGETTVRVRGDGHGGRNQEGVLAGAIELDGIERVCLAFFGTDGIDGTAPPGQPPVAGAMASGATCARARSLDLEPLAMLERNDSYGFFERVGGRLAPGPTGTNVNDVLIGLVY